MPIREPALYLELLIPVHDDVNIPVVPYTRSHELLYPHGRRRVPTLKGALANNFVNSLDGQGFPLAEGNLRSVSYRSHSALKTISANGPAPTNLATPVGRRPAGRSCGYSCYTKVSSPDTQSGSVETTSDHMDAVCSNDNLS